MGNNIETLKPERVFGYFNEITKLPRCSGMEKLISEYLLNFARKKGLDVIQDDALNIIIKKPGTKGYEKAPTVILQGHMDMVCEKDMNVVHDFANDQIVLEVKDDCINAKGTTLGADNGIAIAYFLAILESEDIAHPPLEVVLTTGEEIGMIGADNMDVSNLNGRILINVDSEDEGMLIVGCAGAVTARAKLNIEFENVDSNSLFYNITVSGLEGGHSGLEINEKRANANKIIGRILYDLEDYADYRILNIDGGTKNNAIPRHVETSVCIKDSNVDFADFSRKWNSILENEMKISEPNVRMNIEKMEGFSASRVIDKDMSRKVVLFLMSMPNGVYGMSGEIEGLVESSSNLGIVKTVGNYIIFENMVRSSKNTIKHEIINIIKAIGELVDAEISLEGDYPEWGINPDSKIEKIFTRIHREQYGYPPMIYATHAGLECGIFAAKINGIDIISFGPNIYGAHTTGEKLDIESVQRIWDLLLRLLKEIH